MILGEVRRYLRDSGSIRVARSIKDTAYKIMKLKEELSLELGKEPPISLIASKLGITEFEVSNAMDAMSSPISMFEPIYNDGGDTIYLEDQLSDNSSSYSLDMKIALRDALHKLKEKERYILTERYLVGKTQLELAEDLGISQAQISRLEKSGLENIKKMIS